MVRAHTSPPEQARPYPVGHSACRVDTLAPPSYTGGSHAPRYLREITMWRHTIGRTIILLALSLLTAPLATEAQRTQQVPRIGYLSSGYASSQLTHEILGSLRQGFGEMGWVEGQNVVIAVSTAEGQVERLPALAAELVRLPVAVLFAVGPAALLAAKQATVQIPTVAIDQESDPVQSGFAANLARPGGTITGVFLDMPELVGKWLDLLKEAVPQLTRVAVLWDPTTGPVQREAAQAAARLLAIELHVLEVRTEAEIASTFLAAMQACPDALLVLGSPFIRRHSKLIADLTAHSQLPAIFPFRDFPEVGGLMAYGPPQPELFRRCGVQIGKILHGAKPGDLPIERPMKFELIINLKTAQALGLTLPPTLLLQADKVIK